MIGTRESESVRERERERERKREIEKGSKRYSNYRVRNINITVYT